ncbi:hypothetical protein NDU88_003997 [Pleurodeles waltl]|uniref:Uncharacterized protein n=1 Tax=Pleurodeles waltl TaxID=8319 RepID=A0AAV7TRB3_PLEWA|nr:hypothetical protein NDU88_003997 [Pleurodeles waltl]
MLELYLCALAEDGLPLALQESLIVSLLKPDKNPLKTLRNPALSQTIRPPRTLLRRFWARLEADRSLVDHAATPFPVSGGLGYRPCWGMAGEDGAVLVTGGGRLCSRREHSPPFELLPRPWLTENHIAGHLPPHQRDTTSSDVGGGAPGHANEASWNEGPWAQIRYSTA